MTISMIRLSASITPLFFWKAGECLRVASALVLRSRCPRRRHLRGPPERRRWHHNPQPVNSTTVARTERLDSRAVVRGFIATLSNPATSQQAGRCARLFGRCVFSPSKLSEDPNVDISENDAAEMERNAKIKKNFLTAILPLLHSEGASGQPLYPPSLGGWLCLLPGIQLRKRHLRLRPR
jgi:hypothetical protein